MDLKRIMTIKNIEQQHPYLHDERHYKESHDNWLKTREEWLAFCSLVKDGDVIWEFEDIEVHLGFCSGTGGFLIKRDDRIIEKYITYVVD